MDKKFWLFSGIGAAVAVALIITSLIILLTSPSAPEATEEPLVPVAPEENVVPEEPNPALPEEEEDSSPQVQTVQITESEIVGKTQAQVQEILSSKGLRLDAITGNIAPAQDQVGNAYRLNPQGTVAKNTLIAVYFYAAIPQPPKPRDISVFPATGPYAPGSEVTMEWPDYSQCPSGFPLQSYTLQITGGTLLDAPGLILQPEQTAVTVELADSGQFRASYLVNCGNLTSPISTEVSLTIEAPQP